MIPQIYQKDLTKELRRRYREEGTLNLTHAEIERLHQLGENLDTIIYRELQTDYQIIKSLIDNSANCGGLKDRTEMSVKAKAIVEKYKFVMNQISLEDIKHARENI